MRADPRATDMWTNTCCSHPLGVPSETGAQLDAAVNGVRRAAQRKLDHELGIRAAQVPLDKFDFLTRIHYKAPSDGKWGEHESKWLPDPCTWALALIPRSVDYIMFIKTDVDVEVNPNEVRDTRWVNAEELQTMFQDPALKFTPWFKLICNSMLFEWWSKMIAGQLESYKNEQQIRRML